MKDFLVRHSYLIIWILALVIVGSIATLIIQLNGITTGPIQRSAPAVFSEPPAAAIPAAPSVTLTIVKSPKGNSLVVQWGNLPGDTTALDIFRGKTGSTSTWELWKSLALAPGDLANGTANIDLGTSTLDGYSYYVQAVAGNGDSSSTDNGSTILWTSSSTIPVVTTSTPGNPGSGNPPPENPPPSSPSSPSSSPSSPSSPSSTPPAPQNPSSTPPDQGSSSTNPGNGNNSSTPLGNPYYNPQVQITGYGTAPGSFWVEHVNQSVEIGWQNLPQGITSISVSRSADQAGPWNTILAQQNPGATGSYSLQIVDNTIGDPYYYEMTALNGTTTVATYGPVYLAAH